MVRIESSFLILVGGVIVWLIPLPNETLTCLNSDAILGWAENFLEGLLVCNQSQEGDNRSVMPLDVLGRMRATLTRSESASFAERCG